MAYYGFVITNKGLNLLTKIVAGKQLVLTRVTVGSGVYEGDNPPFDLEDLVQPEAAATSTIPVYDGNAVKLTVEYRSDLNGGLQQGFWLSEFGIFADDPDEGEILLYYGTLGDYPQWVSPLTSTGVDVRRFPVVIILGNGGEVVVGYNCEAWITAEDMEEYCQLTALPMFLQEAGNLIAQHNVDPASHPDIRNFANETLSRLELLELRFDTDVDGNPFLVTFENLDGTTVTGVWNEQEARIEF